MLSRLASFVPDCLPSNQPDKQRAMGRKRKASRAPATQEVVQRQTGKAATGVAKPRKAVQVKSRTKKGTTRQQRPKKQPVEEAEPTDSSDELSVSDDEVEQAALHSDDPDSADTNSSDEEDEEEYSSEYGSSDLDSSDSEDDQDGGSGDKSQVLGKEVGSSGHVAGYGSWVKAEPIEKHGVLEEVKTSGKQLRMHVDDLESDDEVRVCVCVSINLELRCVRWFNRCTQLYRRLKTPSATYRSSGTMTMTTSAMTLLATKLPSQPRCHTLTDSCRAKMTRISGGRSWMRRMARKSPCLGVKWSCFVASKPTSSRIPSSMRIRCVPMTCSLA